MTAYSWNLGSGDWNVASDWSPSGGPPTSSDPATISATGSNYAVTVDSADAASSLTLSSANATLNDDGASASLTIGGTLAISAGTFNLAPDVGRLGRAVTDPRRSLRLRLSDDHGAAFGLRQPPQL